MLLIKKNTPGLAILMIKQINEVCSKQINLIANLNKKAKSTRLDRHKSVNCFNFNRILFKFTLRVVKLYNFFIDLLRFCNEWIFKIIYIYVTAIIVWNFRFTSICNYTYFFIPYSKEKKLKLLWLLLQTSWFLINK